MREFEGKFSQKHRPTFPEIMVPLAWKVLQNRAEGMRVLIADDQPSVGHTLALLVAAARHHVVKIVNSGAEAIQAYRSLHPDVVLMDFSMAKLNGGTAARYIMTEDPAARIVFVSGRYLPNLAGTGAVAVLQKPVDLTELATLLNSMDQQLVFDYSR